MKYKLENVYDKILDRFQKDITNNNCNIKTFIRFFLFYLFARKCSDFNVKDLFKLNKILLDYRYGLDNDSLYLEKILKILINDRNIMEFEVNGFIETENKIF